MKAFTQTLTRNNGNAAEKILRLIFAALSFAREATGPTTGGFLFPAIMPFNGHTHTKEVIIEIGGA